MRTAALSWTIALALAAAPLAAAAQPRGPRAGRAQKAPPPPSPGEDDADLPPPGVLRRVARKLGLSEDQIAKARNIIHEARREMAPLREELATARRDLREHLHGNRVNARRAGDLVDRVGGLRTRIQKTRVLALVRIRGVLTPEQWRRLLELRQTHRGRFRQPF